jgi:mannose-6-phosphate isomerase-like protein (cupin superfamily)
MRKLILGVFVLIDLQAQQPPPTQPPVTQPPATQPPATQPPATQPPQPKPSPPRRATPRTATLAISVADPSGQPMPNVLVTVEGAASRSTRTEGGRIAIEELPVGRYTVRFEQEGFVTVERDLMAAAGKPIDIKVTMKRLPEPPAPAPPPPAPTPEAPKKPSVEAKPAVFDVPAVIEKEFVGRAAGKTTALACGDDSSATLIQLNQPLQQHSHDEADEFIYVVAGEGSASVQGTTQKLRAGTLLFIPRGTSHGLIVSGRNPLIVLSTRAGGGC